MSTDKVNWSVGMGLTVILAGILTGLRHWLLYVPFIPQKTELLITKNRVIENIFAPMGRWIDISVEIIAMFLVVVVVATLFTNEKSDTIQSDTSQVLAGILMGFTLGVSLTWVMPIEAIILVVFLNGIVAMACITINIGKSEDLYGVFAITAGFGISAFIVYGGLITLMALLIFMVANIIGVLCGCLIGYTVCYAIKRRGSWIIK